MNNLITDIFGNQINDSFNRGVIFITPTPDIFFSIATNSQVNLWRFDQDKIKKLLLNNNIDPELYLPIGDCVSHGSRIPMVLIDPDTVATQCDDYISVANFGNGQLWKPVGNNVNYVNMGLVYSANKPLFKVGIVKREFLSISKNSINNIGVLNEFNLVGCNEPMKTFDRMAFLAHYDKSNLLGQVGKKIKNFNIVYNNSGEIINDENLCLTNNDPAIMFQDCNHKSNQQWYLYKNQLISSADGKCVTDSMSVASCDPIDTDILDDKSWIEQEGEKVVLMISSNPWFNNRKNLINVNDYDQQNPLSSNVKYNTNCVIDETKPDLGYGYSYASRLNNCPDNIKNRIIEGFSKTDEKIDIVKIILILLSVVAIYQIMKVIVIKW
jgi:hypothetical protein